MKNKDVFIFIGNSGCGKGTQAKLLREKIEEKGGDVLRLELGGEFREFWQKSGYTAERSSDIAQDGNLQPEFLAIHIWSKMFIEFFTPEKYVIADGVPRQIREAKVLDGALRFYGIEKPTIIYLNISREVAKERMMSRGRFDDTDDAIELRLGWFEREVMRTIDFLKNDEYYNFLDIDAERSIEEIHEDIMEKINL